MRQQATYLIGARGPSTAGDGGWNAIQQVRHLPYTLSQAHNYSAVLR